MKRWMQTRLRQRRWVQICAHLSLVQFYQTFGTSSNETRSSNNVQERWAELVPRRVCWERCRRQAELLRRKCTPLIRWRSTSVQICSFWGWSRWCSAFSPGWSRFDRTPSYIVLQDELPHPASIGLSPAMLISGMVDIALIIFSMRILSFSWLPSSITWPLPMTMILSAFRIVDNRWAMTNVVRPTIHLLFFHKDISSPWSDLTWFACTRASYTSLSLSVKYWGAVTAPATPMNRRIYNIREEPEIPLK